MERCQLALGRGSHLVSGGGNGEFLCFLERAKADLSGKIGDRFFFLPLSSPSSHETAGEFGRG